MGDDSGPNSDGKCTPGDTKPAGDGCNNWICTHDGIWGAISLVGCFRPEQEKCLEEGEFLCDDKNPCCDGLYCCNEEHKCKRKDDSDEKCVFEDKEYKIGETRRCWCNTCTCMKGGRWASSRRRCPTPEKKCNDICTAHYEP